MGVLLLLLPLRELRPPQFLKAGVLVPLALLLPLLVVLSGKFGVRALPKRCEGAGESGPCAASASALKEEDVPGDVTAEVVVESSAAA